MDVGEILDNDTTPTLGWTFYLKGTIFFEIKLQMKMVIILKSSKLLFFPIF